MKYIRLNDRKSDEAALREKILNSFAMADGFLNAAAARAVHPGIIEVYTRYCDAAFETIRNHQNYQIEEVVQNAN